MEATGFEAADLERGDGMWETILDYVRNIRYWITNVIGEQEDFYRVDKIGPSGVYAGVWQDFLRRVVL